MQFTKTMTENTTITAISTPPGTGAIAVIRISGPEATGLCDSVFRAPSGKRLIDQSANTLHYGTIADDDELIDEVVVALFKSPHSYTGEDVVEISCHGSVYIQQRILELLVKKGAIPAKPGEFTMRAFFNGKLDLTQVEAVADLIASGSKAAHRVAMNQMRGGFAKEISTLRKKLLSFISLVELELDFSEEDVEFANRSELKVLLDEISVNLYKLKNSFILGNVIKKGIPVTITGKTNSGKSTLLNLLVHEEKAIVSDIEGTTRDSIEDLIIIRGLLFRLIDTAGIRHTEDTIEKLGIERSREKIRQASVIIQLLDATESPEAAIRQLNELSQFIRNDEKKRIVALNKIDLLHEDKKLEFEKRLRQKIDKDDFFIMLSAKTGLYLDSLENALVKASGIHANDENDIIITNVRHFDSIGRALNALSRAIEGLESGISTDLMAQDIRESLRYLGEITGEITDNVTFCIGK